MNIAVTIGAALVSCALCALFTKYIIPKLKSLKMGQKILEIGPRWHKSKEGTPTMGGLAMITAAVFTVLVIAVLDLISGGENSYITVRLVAVVLYAAVSGFIGIIDDRVKLMKKQNEGLKAWQKYLFQLGAAGIFLLVMKTSGNIDTSLRIPYTDISVELGIFYYIIALLLLTGINNAVNLTDGIDGLASGVTFFVGCFYTAAAFATGSGNDTAVLGAVTMGVCAGFLVYNFYPARIFMGDTGSLFLGGLVVGGAFMLNNPLIVLIVGIVYVIETLSVILQVCSFKLTGKRIFKMAPIHHHFEMCGWSEIKIVTVACGITVLAAVGAYFGL